MTSRLRRYILLKIVCLGGQPEIVSAGVLEFARLFMARVKELRIQFNGARG